jgi:hypothetical protein
MPILGSEKVAADDAGEHWKDPQRREAQDHQRRRETGFLSHAQPCNIEVQSSKTLEDVAAYRG